MFIAHCALHFSTTESEFLQTPFDILFKKEFINYTGSTQQNQFETGFWRVTPHRRRRWSLENGERLTNNSYVVTLITRNNGNVKAFKSHIKIFTTLSRRVPLKTKVLNNEGFLLSYFFVKKIPLSQGIWYAGMYVWICMLPQSQKGYYHR